MLKMGAVWDGLAEVRAAFGKAAAYDGPDAVDLTAVRREIELFHRMLGTRPFDASAFEELLQQVKTARDALRPGRINDSRWCRNPGPATRDVIRGMQTDDQRSVRPAALCWFRSSCPQTTRVGGVGVGARKAPRGGHLREVTRLRNLLARNVSGGHALSRRS